MVKKLFRYLVRTLSALLICILIYFVYILKSSTKPFNVLLACTCPLLLN